MTERRYESFQEFWPFYVREHADPANRRMHTIGTAIVITLALAALISGNGWLLLLLPIAGYGFAWFGHFVLQKNRPATFTYPLWSLMADFKMFFYTLTGRMTEEVRRASDDHQHDPRHGGHGA